MAIDDALYRCDFFLIVLSKASVESHQVRGELQTALDDKKAIIPVLIETCRVPGPLRVIQYIDFRSSEPDHSEVISQLLRAVGRDEKLSVTPDAPKTAPLQTIDPKTVEVRKIRILIASSAELCEERNKFWSDLRTESNRFLKKGVYLEFVLWENALDTVPTGGEDAFNGAVRDIDIFVALFFTETGTFPREGFEIAHKHFLEANRPRIYVFFKKWSDDELNARIFTAPLYEFQLKLVKLRIFSTDYNNNVHLKREFVDQLNQLFP